MVANEEFFNLISNEVCPATVRAMLAMIHACKTCILINGSSYIRICSCTNYDVSSLLSILRKYYFLGRETLWIMHHTCYLFLQRSMIEASIDTVYVKFVKRKNNSCK